MCRDASGEVILRKKIFRICLPRSSTTVREKSITFRNAEIKVGKKEIQVGRDSAASQKHCGRKITVLFVQYLAENSGSWQVLRTLIARLDPERFRILLVLPRKGEVEAVLSPYVRIHYVGIPRLRRSLSPGYLSRFLIGVIPAILALCRIIRKESIDIVHCNGLPNLFPAFAAVLSGVPLVWHVHELEFRPMAVFRALVWLCGKLADRIACVSQGVVRLFGGSDKALLIYNGVDVNHFRPDAVSSPTDRLRRIRGEKDGFVVTQLGRIVPIKGVEWFIALAEAVTTRKLPGAESVRFVLVGSPIPGHEAYFESMLGKIQTSTARDQLIYVPAVEDPRAVLAVTDILVQSSVISESFGLSLVEAMAMGKPVMASPVGGPVEIIRDGVDGFLVSPYDVSRRAEIIAELFRDRARLAKLGVNGRGRAGEKFSADRMAREFQALYRSLCPSQVNGNC